MATAPRRARSRRQGDEQPSPVPQDTPNRSRAVQRLPLTISEADFQRTVIQTAMVYGWRVSHQRPAQVRTGRWATAITGHPGLPDLVLSRDGVVLVAELKTQHGRLTPGQIEWLRHLGAHGRCWRPSDWPAVVAELRGPMGGAA